MKYPITMLLALFLLAGCSDDARKNAWDTLDAIAGPTMEEQCAADRKVCEASAYRKGSSACARVKSDCE